jgi:hypothetical protein
MFSLEESSDKASHQIKADFAFWRDWAKEARWDAGIDDTVYLQ